MVAEPDDFESQETVGNEPPASYSVLAFLGPQLPSQYVNMVYSKWMTSLRYGNDYFRLMESGSYFSAYKKYIASILARSSCVVRVAALTDNRDTCLGFSVSDAKTLHYIHVHKYNRRQGIGRSLVPFQPEIITHLTKTGMILWAEKIPHAVFNPFI